MGGGVGKNPTSLSVEQAAPLYPGLPLPSLPFGYDLPGRLQRAQQQEGPWGRWRPWKWAPATWHMDPVGGLYVAQLDLK